MQTITVATTIYITQLPNTNGTEKKNIKHIAQFIHTKDNNFGSP